jgi:hypothetical protein
VAAAGATEVDGAEAGRADTGAGAEAGAAATLTGLGAGVVAPWVPVEPTAWTVELTAWVTLDGAAATDDSGEEPVAPEPEVAGATRVECPVDVELADGVAVDELAETEAAADVTALAGVELAGAVDWAGVEWADAVESPCESAEPTGLAWDDVPWATAEATEPTVCRALPGPEVPAAEDGDDGVVSAWACWCEKSTSMIRIPAASNPACTARRAMPRSTAWATRCSQRWESLVRSYLFTMLAHLCQENSIYSTLSTGQVRME